MGVGVGEGEWGDAWSDTYNLYIFQDSRFTSMFMDKTTTKSETLPFN